MSWRPDHRPVQTHPVQNRLFISGQIHVRGLELDNTKQLQRPIFERRQLSHHSSIEAPSSRSRYHQRPSRIGLLEGMRSQLSSGLLFQSGRTPNLIQVPVSQQYKLQVRGFRSQLGGSFENSLLATGQSAVY